MEGRAKKFGRVGTALFSGLVLALPAEAQTVDLSGPETLTFSADERIVFSDGEKSWAAGEFGKLRSGDEGGLRLGHADLVWQPRLGWATSATVAASVQQAGGLRFGISEAFLSLRSKPGSGVRPSARLGLMWPPISLEHEGADWHVADTITPSAINSWVAEEIRPLAAEATLTIPAGEHRIEATAAAFAANDTAGTLLTFRGWALHDLKLLNGRRWALPDLPADFAPYQPRYTHPLLDVLPGFAKRPGYYAKIAWAPPAPVRVELFRYDNRADPEAANENAEWGWRTRFAQIGLIAKPTGRVSVKTQFLSGRTEMGFEESGRYWIDGRYRSGFVLATWSGDNYGFAARGEVFGVQQRGSVVASTEDDRGWAATFAGHRRLDDHLALWAEALHVSSDRDARGRIGLASQQSQTQLQVAVRGDW